MRISDWSSDVCCSDLVFEILAALLHGPPERRGDFAPVIAEEPERPFRGDGRIKLAQGPGGRISRIHRHADAGRRQSLRIALRPKTFLPGSACDDVDRKSVGEGKSGSGCVESGGGRILKKKRE